MLPMAVSSLGAMNCTFVQSIICEGHDGSIPRVLHNCLRVLCTGTLCQHTSIVGPPLLRLKELSFWAPLLRNKNAKSSLCEWQQECRHIPIFTCSPAQGHAASVRHKRHAHARSMHAGPESARPIHVCGGHTSVRKCSSFQTHPSQVDKPHGEAFAR